jgi:hypothetical protein
MGQEDLGGEALGGEALGAMKTWAQGSAARQFARRIPIEDAKEFRPTPT